MKTSDRAVGRELKKSVKAIEQELTIAAKILDWEIGDLWGHVGVRLPDDKGIAVKMFRRPERDKKDWLVHFDFSLKKLSGVGTIPREAVIYTEIFKARPDVNAAVHCHASMCVALEPGGQARRLGAYAVLTLQRRHADLSPADLHSGRR